MENWISRGAAVLAGAGGVVLVAMAVVTVASVLGRAIPGLPAVPGDFELVEMGAAICVFLFLPWCQISGGQVAIDLLTARLAARANAGFTMLGNAVLTGICGVLAWRMWLGFGEKFPFGSEALRAALALGERPYFTETSFELLIPVWIPFGLCLPGAAWLVLACAATTWRAFRQMREGAPS